MIRYVWLLLFPLLLVSTSCTKAPLRGPADALVVAETREDRKVRINGFAAIAVNYAVDVTTIGEAEKVDMFITRLTAALDRLEAEPIWVETEIQEIVTLFAEGLRGRLDTSRFFGLLGGGIPSIGNMLDKLRNVAKASAMLRDVRWVMEQVQAGTMTAADATAAFRERIDREAAAIRRLVE